MPVTVKLSELRRALDVTSYLVRNGASRDDYVRVLQHVHISRTAKGLTVQSTDRYALLMAHVPVENRKTKLSDIYLTPRVITKMLSMLAEAYAETPRRDTGDLEVTISTDDKRGHVTFEAEGLPVTVPNASVGGYPALETLIGPSSGGIVTEQPLRLNPNVLQCIMRLEKHGCGEGLIFTHMEGKQNAHAPLRFQFGDWAVGCIMPMRVNAEPPVIDWLKS